MLVADLRIILLSVLLAVVLLLAVRPVLASAQGDVLVVTISSEISRTTEELVTRSIAEAEAGNARLIVYELNTPGGELDSVTNIMNDFNSSPIPILVWVTPTGASAWSGGTYILMASGIAAMASGTTIGSAQPVSATGEVLNESKYINALSGLMADNARLHDRNGTVAQEFVTENLNLGPEEALRLHVIEFIADSLQSLLSQLEPYSLVLSTTASESTVWSVTPTNTLENVPHTQTFDFAGVSQATVFTYDPGIGIGLLTVLSNPIIAIVLFLVGLYAIIIGFKTPGFGLEIVGGLMFFLSLIGFGIIGISTAAILLFVIGIILTLIEIKTHIGVFALGGIGFIIVGSFFAFPLPGWELLSAQAVESSRETLVSVTLVMSAIFGLVVYKVAQARRMKIKTGPEQLIGSIGSAISELAPSGEVRVEGQVWRAETIGGTIKRGESVEVIRREGLILRVKPTHEN